MKTSATANATASERLDSKSYLAAHEAFRRYSNQREMVMEWFEQSGLIELGVVAPSVLAVGAGGGDVDVALISEIGQFGAFSYDAIDPNRAALERFRGRCDSLAAADSRRVWFHHGNFEGFEPGHRYDLIHFIHAIYSISDLSAAVAKAHRLLEDGGRMAIVCSTDEGVNSFKRDALAAIGRPTEGTTVPEAKLLKALSELEGTSMELGMIPSRINVEPCFAKIKEGERVLSFFLQSEFSALPSDAQDEVLGALEKHCIGEVGNRGIAQPMLGISLKKESATAGRRVGMKVSNRRQLDELEDVAVFA